MKCRVYKNIDCYEEVLYEGELTIKVLKEVEKWCEEHTVEYGYYIPAFHVCDNGVIEIGPSGEWEC